MPVTQLDPSAVVARTGVLSQRACGLGEADTEFGWQIDIATGILDGASISSSEQFHRAANSAVAALETLTANMSQFIAHALEQFEDVDHTLASTAMPNVKIVPNVKVMP